MGFLKLLYTVTLKQIKDMAYSVWIIVLPMIVYLSLRLLWPATAEGGALAGGLTLFFCIAAGLMNQPLLYAQMREDHMLDRIRTTPAPGFYVPASLILSTLVLCAAGTMLISIAGLLFGDISIAAVGSYIACSVSAAFLFLMAGLPLPFMFRDFMVLKNVTSILAFTLLAFAGIFFLLPDGWQIIHTVNPASGIYENLRLASTSGELSLTGFIPAGVLALAGAFMALVLSRREA